MHNFAKVTVTTNFRGRCVSVLKYLGTVRYYGSTGRGIQQYMYSNTRINIRGTGMIRRSEAPFRPFRTRRTCNNLETPNSNNHAPGARTDRAATSRPSRRSVDGALPERLRLRLASEREVNGEEPSHGAAAGGAAARPAARAAHSPARRSIAHHKAQR